MRPANTSSAAAESTVVLLVVLLVVDDEPEVLVEPLGVVGVVELLVVFDEFVIKMGVVVAVVELVVLGAIMPNSTSGAVLLLSPSATAETDAPERAVNEKALMKLMTINASVAVSCESMFTSTIFRVAIDPVGVVPTNDRAPPELSVLITVNTSLAVTEPS